MQPQQKFEKSDIKVTKGKSLVKLWLVGTFLAIIVGITVGYCTWLIVREQPDGSAVVRLG